MYLHLGDETCACPGPACVLGEDVRGFVGGTGRPPDSLTTSSRWISSLVVSPHRRMTTGVGTGLGPHVTQFLGLAGADVVAGSGCAVPAGSHCRAPVAPRPWRREAASRPPPGSLLRSAHRAGGPWRRSAAPRARRAHCRCLNSSVTFLESVEQLPTNTAAARHGRVVVPVASCRPRHRSRGLHVATSSSIRAPSEGLRRGRCCIPRSGKEECSQRNLRRGIPSTTRGGVGDSGRDRSNGRRL